MKMDRMCGIADDEELERVAALTKTVAYANALAKIGRWERTLIRGGKKEAEEVGKEMEAFFVQVKTRNPLLYDTLRLNRLSLYETIHSKMTGKGIIVD